MKTLNVSNEMKLPLAIASQTTCIVGIRGSGKTNTAGVLAEELLDVGHPVVIIDPTDAWWGLRSRHPVFIFGGSHGDLPLNETDGKTIAEFVIAERVPLILSLRHLRKAAQRRLVTDFAEELYHRKGKADARWALTVIIDEAPLFVPQAVTGDVARTVGAMEDFVARGRNAGFGVVLISQRFATINKNVSTQCDTIIAHRLPSPQDRKALQEWIDANASIEQRDQVLGSLAGLKNGMAWIWSPALDILKQIQVRKRHSFDSSATPAPGQIIKAPKDLEKIDLDKLKGKLAQSVEQAKANDPRELKRRIAELEKIAAKPAPAARPEKPAINAKQIARVETASRKFEAAVGKVAEMITGLQALAKSAGIEVATISQAIKPAAPIARPAAPAPSPARPRPARIPQAEGALGELSKCERAIMQVLANHPSYCPLNKVALLSGYTSTGGGFRNALGSLRTKDLIEGDNASGLSISELGLSTGPYEALPTGDELVDYWKAHPSMGAAERMIIDALRGKPSGLLMDELGAATGYTTSGGGFRNALGKLRTVGVLVGKNNERLRLADSLLEG